MLPRCRTARHDKQVEVEPRRHVTTLKWKTDREKDQRMGLQWFEYGQGSQQTCAIRSFQGTSFDTSVSAFLATVIIFCLVGTINLRTMHAAFAEGYLWHNEWQSARSDPTPISTCFHTSNRIWQECGCDTNNTVTIQYEMGFWTSLDFIGPIWQCQPSKGAVLGNLGAFTRWNWLEPLSGTLWSWRTLHPQKCLMKTKPYAAVVVRISSASLNVASPFFNAFCSPYTSAFGCKSRWLCWWRQSLVNVEMEKTDIIKQLYTIVISWLAIVLPSFIFFWSWGPCHPQVSKKLGSFRCLEGTWKHSQLLDYILNSFEYVWIEWEKFLSDRARPCCSRMFLDFSRYFWLSAHFPTCGTSMAGTLSASWQWPVAALGCTGAWRNKSPTPSPSCATSAPSALCSRFSCASWATSFEHSHSPTMCYDVLPVYYITMIYIVYNDNITSYYSPFFIFHILWRLGITRSNIINLYQSQGHTQIYQNRSK